MLIKLIRVTYGLNWEETRIKRQIKCHNMDSFQVASKITVNYPKAMVSLQRKSTTGISLENLRDFDRLLWMAISKVILTD